MLSDNIKISVVIPCYNQGNFLEEAVQSVLNSDSDEYEIIIVNDGSTEAETLQVFENLEQVFSDHPKITVIYQANSGLSAARNTGIQRARGEYILPLDADDKIRPHYLTKASEILDSHPDVGVVYPYAQLFGERSGLWEFPRFDAKRLLLNNFIVSCSVYRKKVWEMCNGYDPNMKAGYEDWEFWIRVMKNRWKFHLIEEAMFDYRVRKGSMVAACNIPENRRVLIQYICTKHRDIYLENLEYVISEKDAALLCANKQIRHLEQTIREKEISLNHIYHSKGWKILFTCYKIRDRVFPENTSRRRLLDKFLEKCTNQKPV